MTALTNSQQQVMETLKAQFNANYAHEYAHRDDVTTKFYLIFDLQDLGLVETLEDDTMFIRLTQAGREYLGLTVSEVKTEVSQAKADLEDADFGGIVIDGDTLTIGDDVSITMKVDPSTDSILWIAKVNGEFFGHSDCSNVVGLVEKAYKQWFNKLNQQVEVASEVEVEMISPDGKKFVASAKDAGNNYVVKTSMREVKFNKKTMKATGKFAGWRLALISKASVGTVQPQNAKVQQVNPDLFEAYQKAVIEFETANEVYHKAEAEWLKTGQWPDDKRDAGKVREAALDAKKVASNNYYNN